MNPNIEDRPAPMKISPKVNCDFCGKHKNLVPLLITSNITGSTICGYCAVLVVQQTMQHQIHMGLLLKNLIDEYPDMFERDENGAIRVVPGNEILLRAVHGKTSEEDHQEGDEEPLCESGDKKSTVEGA